MTPEMLAKMLVTPRRRRHASSEGSPARGAALLHPRWIGEPLSRRRALLVHGWEADHLDMAAIANDLQYAGFYCALPDLPAHGASTISDVTIPEAAGAILHFAATYGPFEVAIGHSVGAAIVLYAAAHGLQADKLILLTPPRNYVEHLREQALRAGAPNALVDAAIDVLRRRSPDIDRVDNQILARRVRIPGLIVSAGKDEVLDPENGPQLAGALAAGVHFADLQATHRSVLESDLTLTAIRTFVSPGHARD